MNANCGSLKTVKRDLGSVKDQLDSESSILLAEFGRNGETGNTSRKLNRIYEAIEGNGKPGLFIRMDRLEQSHKQRQWLSRTVTVAIITCAVSTAAQVAMLFLSK